MAQLFPRWTNRVPLILLIGVVFAGAAVVGAMWYFGSPEFTDVGYRPAQPIPYSHKLHAGDLGMECRYCHWTAEVADHANVPSTRTCMNCHRLILPESAKLLLLHESRSTATPIFWVRVHKLPDYAYFDHSAHLGAGVGCSTCHGDVARMHVVMQAEPLSMGWCLKCHRRPQPSLRPSTEITLMTWSPGPEHHSFVSRWIAEKDINPPLDCSGCHR